MADARALLRARRQEARITHPYASYSSSGQLRCTPCGSIVKQASMWEGHIGSKTHRVAVMKMREKEEEERRRAAKRKASDDDDGDAMDVDAKKRRLSDEESDEEVPASNTANAKGTSGGFPIDFFSDSSKAPVLSSNDAEDEVEMPVAVPPPAAAKEKSQVDLEWERFQATVLNNAADQDREDDRRDAFERATVFAEPELAPSATEGFPPSVLATDSAAPNAEPEKEETEEEKRQRKEREDRELIMDRLIEEERAQEEADERVELLKARVEALKKAREAKRAGKKAKS